jgi:hypothetical protein
MTYLRRSSCPLNIQPKIIYPMRFAEVCTRRCEIHSVASYGNVADYFHRKVLASLVVKKMEQTTHECEGTTRNYTDQLFLWCLFPSLYQYQHRKYGNEDKSSSRSDCQCTAAPQTGDCRRRIAQNYTLLLSLRQAH